MAEKSPIDTERPKIVTGHYRPAYLTANDINSLKTQLVTEFRNIGMAFDKLIERMEALEKAGK